MNHTAPSEILLCDARHPLISGGKLYEEAILYNIRPGKLSQLASMFTEITGIDISPESELGALSGGQKVLLMFLLAVHSPAGAIQFVDLTRSLDNQTRERVQFLLQSVIGTKEISFVKDTDVH